MAVVTGESLGRHVPGDVITLWGVADIASMRDPLSIHAARAFFSGCNHDPMVFRPFVPVNFHSDYVL